MGLGWVLLGVVSCIEERGGGEKLLPKALTFLKASGQEASH